MQKYPKALDPMQQKQNQFFTILGSREKSLEKFSFDFDVPKSILRSEGVEQ